MARKTGYLAKRGESRHHREKIFSNDSFPHQLTVMMCFFFSSHDDARRGWSYCAWQHMGAWRMRWCVLVKPDFVDKKSFKKNRFMVDARQQKSGDMQRQRDPLWTVMVGGYGWHLAAARGLQVRDRGTAPKSSGGAFTFVLVTKGYKR